MGMNENSVFEYKVPLWNEQKAKFKLYFEFILFEQYESMLNTGIHQAKNTLHELLARQLASKQSRVLIQVKERLIKSEKRNY